MTEEKNRVAQVAEELWTQQNFRQGDVIDRKFVDELVAHVYKTACMDCMVMLEDCSGFNLRDEVK